MRKKGAADMGYLRTSAHVDHKNKDLEQNVYAPNEFWPRTGQSMN